MLQAAVAAATGNSIPKLSTTTPNPAPTIMNVMGPGQGGHSHIGAADTANSDTISETSDTQTILSLSRDDLTAVGAGQIREDVRVSRKKLEGLILREREEAAMMTTTAAGAGVSGDGDGSGGMEAAAGAGADGSPRSDGPEHKGFMESLMENTNTFIQWPSRMKIGAKTKKDLFVRIYGHNPEDVNNAKQIVLQELGPHRDLRITLKMEISYTDHSHLIGCRGATIRKVMEDTGCHIHFPDSNRMSKDHKSNQVTIAGGSIQAVEQARARVRDLSPLIFQFNLPVILSQYDYSMNPDAHNIFIDNIQSNYNVQVTIHPPNKLQQTTIAVKGCEIDSLKIKEAIEKIVGYFSSGTPVSSLTVESTMEISAVQHAFVRAVNDSNIHSIMMNTGAKIIFPDLSDTNIQQIKRSRIYIAGEINRVYFARQQLLGCLPLRMIFDLADDYPIDWDDIRVICGDLNVNVKLINRNRPQTGGPGSSLQPQALPPPVPGRSRTLQLIAGERNANNLYEARRRILGGIEPPVHANIPNTYALRSVLPGGIFSFANQLTVNPPPTAAPLPPLLIPSSPSMVSPILSPSFWPPNPFSPFMSPSLPNCGATLGQFGIPEREWKSPEPSMFLGVGHGQGHSSSGVSSNRSSFGNTVGFPQFSPNEMTLMHAGLETHHQGQGTNKPQPVSARPSTAQTVSSSGTSSASISPETYQHHHQQQQPEFQIHRRAPGFERSNTNPSILISPPTDGPASSIGTDSSAATAKDPVKDKRHMAMKAMYQTKVGTAPRVPTGEWSGFGFSKTHLNLFPTKKETTTGAEAAAEKTDEMLLMSDSLDKLDTNNNTTPVGKDKISGDGGSAGARVPTPKTPLSKQSSNNVFELGSSRPIIDPSIDLPTMFLQNGLDKYIDTFVREEIDMDSFRGLTEPDLRSLGVTSFPARKKMLGLIQTLGFHPDQLWK